MTRRHKPVPTTPDRLRPPLRHARLAPVRLCLLVLALSGAPQASSAQGTSVADSLPSSPPSAFVIERLSSLRPPEDFGRFAPEALALDGLGRLFALDRAGSRIARISPEGGWSLFGVGDQGGERLSNLSSLFAHWGPDLFALDPAAGRLYQFDLDGHLKKSLAYGEGMDQEALRFLQPSDFALTRSGELLFLDRSGRLLLFDRFGRFVTDLASGGAGSDRLQSPQRLVQDDDGEIFVLDPPARRIRHFSRQGAQRPSWSYADGLPAASSGSPLLGMVAGEAIAVLTRDGARLRLFDPSGTLLLDWTNPEPGDAPLSDLVASPDSLLYVSSPNGGEILRWRWSRARHGGPGIR